MESVAQITLVDKAAIVVAASVWYHEDVIERIRKSSSGRGRFDQHKRVKMEIKVNKNILTLPLTVSTQQRVENFSVFVGKGIEQWIQDHCFLTINSSVLSSLLCWNPKGVIDCIATAKNIICHEKNLINCFRIACMYCLENYIFQLWDLIERQNLLYDIHVMECFELKFWISYIKHNMNVLMDEIQYIGNRDTLCFAFNISVTNNNAVWTEHFLKKMTEDQICTIAYRKLKYILEMPLAFNYKMIPLLSRYVNSEMFNELILNYPGIILLNFLQFPIIEDFLKIANKTRDVLTNEDFYLIIERMAHFLQEYGRNQTFENISQQFWKNSTDHCKIYVIQKCINGSFLNRLALLKHSSPIVQLIIQSSTTHQKKEMIFSYNGIIFFDSLIRKNRWGCFSMSIQEFVGSEDRENWINELIQTYQHIFKISRFPSFTSEDYKKLINILKQTKELKYISE
ncbi:uncharacterized protein LOC129984350 [Argiope bruennichi]|uniref:Uncharacterized protein n=1 Tax=Argiope bruennichi TaxID=94029 RepID=A0A8T0EGT1_ARGBR|nr:uncharacterized protein LOC129984350 [Argiope bruennichi]XP_055950193.1 uncharacterized protein LOC129984350 [Argiope bruennichi]KAF8772990.1 hypothetical protein HNY73_015693 [Argiope bruennichi]